MTTIMASLSFLYLIIFLMYVVQVLRFLHGQPSLTREDTHLVSHVQVRTGSVSVPSWYTFTALCCLAHCVQMDHLLQASVCAARHAEKVDVTARMPFLQLSEHAMPL